MSQFATAINCMDGRVQLPVIEWMKKQFNVDYIDMITEAGPNKVLLEGTPEQLQAIQAKVQVSYGPHGSKVIAIVGHHDCAGNPIPKDEKVEQIKQSVELIRSWGLEVKVLGLYVNKNWEVEPVTEI
ncbi:carbonic anhydrase [Pullulanibacillus pueri]|uniref:Carbonic anhydrase n=1 Tax=Pullulanibacillus pueri TaxID=1437324 RepID=A0A8J2ZXK2_9BACL|nr:carbonic anhydrase [Pullulanibacillus pueri]MBM7683863.1 carbonic anhydrase [Pullulanibacillus pueri]GGH84596.1 hypothetical protein GCM10007096_28040 [Pullulanibacillus pueri]